MKTIVLLVIRAYRALLSPLLPPVCRFWPTCSRYAYEAVERHGVLAGGWLAVKRLARCHPFHPGGIDPVPVPEGEGERRRDGGMEKPSALAPALPHSVSPSQH